MSTRFLEAMRSDRGENSIMQTITIAVSAILIAAGLITAPGLINNARDNNARGDLANVSFAQEYRLANAGNYSPNIVEGVNGIDGGMKYTLSNEAANYDALVCSTPAYYLMKAKSESGKTFYKSSESSKISSNIAEIEVNPCVGDITDFTDTETPGAPSESPATAPSAADMALVEAAVNSAWTNTYNVYLANPSEYEMNDTFSQPNRYENFEDIVTSEGDTGITAIINAGQDLSGFGMPNTSAQMMVDGTMIQGMRDITAEWGTYSTMYGWQYQCSGTAAATPESCDWYTGDIGMGG